MKLFRFHASLASVTLLALMLCFGCSPEQVNPKNPGQGGPTITTSSENPHPVFQPNCSDSITAFLTDRNGNRSVDYCKNWPFFRPCPTNPADWGQWGNVEIINGWDSISIRVNLVSNWYIDSLTTYIGGSTPLSIPVTDVPPTVNNTWGLTNAGRTYNSYSFFFDKRDIWKDALGCFLSSVRISVYKIQGFNPNPDPDSRRQLWINSTGMTVKTFSLDQTGNVINTAIGDTADYQTTNPYIFNWCWQRNCRTQVMGGMYLTNSCASIPSITIPSNCDETGGHGCNYGTGPSVLNIVNANQVRCIDTSASLGTFNFSSNSGTLIIKPGKTVTAAINAYYGCTLIVQGTLNWINTASYSSNMQIYIAPGGRINRAGSTGSLTLNNASSRLINEGEIDIDANLISRGPVYNKGTLTARNITMTGGSANLVNHSEINVEQTLTLNCGTPSTCTSNGDNLQNCGKILVNTAISAGTGTNAKNYCTLITYGSYTQGGNFTNQGVTVAGLTGAGNGFVNNGNTVFNHNSIVLTRAFNWGTSRTIELNYANAWIVSGNIALNPSPSPYLIQSITGTGRFNIPSGSALTGSGGLNFVDADGFVSGDAPATGQGIAQLLIPSGSSRISIFTRGVTIQDDSLETCFY